MGSNNFDGPIILDQDDTYLGFGRAPNTEVSTRSRVLWNLVDPNGVRSAIIGSICLSPVGTWENTDGATAWSLLSSGGPGGGWTDDGVNVRLTTAGDTVSVGTAVAVPSRKFTVVNTGVALGSRVVGLAGTDNALDLFVTAEANARWSSDVSGNFAWGPGGATPLDTQLQRVDPGVLQLTNPGVLGNAALQFDDGQNAAVSAAGTGRLRYAVPGNQFEVSLNGAAYVALATAAVAGGWTDSGAFVQLTTSTDQVTVGGVAAVVGRKVEILTTGANQGLRVTPTAAGDNVVDALVSGEANASWQVLGRGETLWGAGGAGALDTRLRRTAASTLTLDDGAAGAAILLPGADGVGDIGANGQRWNLVRAVTITSGAYLEEEVFAEESLGLEDLLAVLEAELAPGSTPIPGGGTARHLARIVMLTARAVLASRE